MQRPNKDIKFSHAHRALCYSILLEDLEQREGKSRIKLWHWDCKSAWQNSDRSLKRSLFSGLILLILDWLFRMTQWLHPSFVRGQFITADKSIITLNFTWKKVLAPSFTPCVELTFIVKPFNAPALQNQKKINRLCFS